jgi:AcrR family transcriptional regulator
MMRAAVELMAHQGYDGTSTRDMASAAGVSVAALYYHFPSKLDLLREFLQEAHDVVLARLGRALDGAGADPRERLDVAVSTLIWSNLHDEWATRAALVSWRERGRLEVADQELIAQKVEQMVDLVEAVVAVGVADGTFRTNEPRDVARAVLTLSTSVVDATPGAARSMARVIEQHQRFAAALADTAPKAARQRRGSAG